MSKRKFVSEFGLNMQGSVIMTQQDGLDKLGQIGEGYHIYMIAQRPRITLNPASVVFTATTVEGEFRVQVRDVIHSIPFRSRNLMGSADLQLECSYPYTEFAVVDSSGTRVSHGKSALLMPRLGVYSPHLDLEILYVGQAYGEHGSRTAVDRLQSHSTLQKIYAHACVHSPDREIWILLWTFNEVLMASFDGLSGVYEATSEQDLEHIQTVLQTPITDQQKINFTEAALIRYFQPEYNKTFKQSFPNPAHETYSQCYEVDLNSVCVELDTDGIAAKLFSSTVSPDWLHLIAYPLHSTEDRMSMFQFP